jgi:predicted transcriptional regulator
MAHKVNRMSDTTVKQQALNAVQSLPDSATFEDVLEQLLFISKVERGLAEADAGQLIPHEQVKARFGL